MRLIVFAAMAAYTLGVFAVLFLVLGKLWDYLHGRGFRV